MGFSAMCDTSTDAQGTALMKFTGWQFMSQMKYVFCGLTPEVASLREGQALFEVQHWADMQGLNCSQAKTLAMLLY